MSNLSDKKLIRKLLAIPILTAMLLMQPAIQEVAVVLADVLPIGAPIAMKELGQDSYMASDDVQVVVDNAGNENIELTLINAQGQEVDMEVREVSQDRQRIFQVLPPAELMPGKYTIQASDGETTTTQDFSWGVLALNPNKSIYLPGQTADLAMAVLDEKGNMVCDAELELRIMNNEYGIDDTLSTDNGQIKVNPECQRKAIVEKPDYEAAYLLEKLGRYTLTLTATTDQGSYAIEDALEVRSSVAFDIERSTATRIYPVEKYPVNINVTANQDFDGTIREVVPDSFEIENIAAKIGGTAVPNQDITTSSGLETDKQATSSIATSLGYPLDQETSVVLGFGQELDDQKLSEFYAKHGLDGHDGIDFAVPSGTPVLASDKGTVIYAADGDYGQTIAIQHEWGRSYYGHLSNIEIKLGDIVTKGQKIGLSGASGLSSVEPRLHFGIKPNDHDLENGYIGKINPEPFLPSLHHSRSSQQLKVISWEVSLKKGQEIELSYVYDAPNHSPQFYTLGPLSFVSGQEVVFQENRLWQIASDAAIAFRSTTESTSSTVSVPAGTVQDDVLIAHACRADDGVVSTPGGWTAIRNDTVGNDLRCYVFYRVAGVSEPSSYSFTGAEFGAMAAYSGVDTANPIHAHNGSNGRSSSIIAPSVTTTLDDVVLLGLFAIDDNGETIAVPGSMTERWNVTDASGVSAMSDELWSTAGATGTRTATHSGFLERWVAHTVALTPGATSTFEQADYRIFTNSDSTDVGAALAAQNTAATLSAPGDAFRLRQLLHIGNDDLSQNDQDFKLQYAGKGGGTCATPSGGSPSTYTDVGIQGDSWSTDMWEQRTKSASTVFDGKLWISGGADSPGSKYFNDVWYSSDGVSWTQATGNAAWSARSSHSMVAFNDKLWVIGGYGSATGYVTDVWSSPDGITWTQETADTGWADRSYHDSIVFNNKIWTLGGSEIVSGTTYYDEVWSSSDGANWTLETSTPGWTGRTSPGAVVFNNKLWVVGGYDGSTQVDDIWSSSDGVTWTQETTNPGWAARSAHAVVSHNSKLWVLGGWNDPDFLGDVWSSADGTTWTQETASAAWGIRNYLLAESFNGSIVVTGGNNSSYLLHDVWSSSDGASWSRVDELGWTQRYYHASVVFNNKMWIIGGSDATFRNDIWSSPDGITWTQETASAAWSARNALEAVVFNNKIWIFGGWNGSTNLDEVWSSSDGVNWTLETSNPGWNGRSYHQVVVFNNKLWLMGGFDGTTNLDDVWSSSDGVNWTQETASPGWTGRSYSQVKVFENKIWLTGGNSGNAGADDHNDVWSSSDGVNWTQETSNAAWSDRQGHQMVVYGGKLWLMGGATEDDSFFNDVWSSSDGVNWTQETASAAWQDRREHTSLVFDGRVWLLGGRDGTVTYNSVWFSDPTLIAWNDNDTPTHGATVTVNADDPSHSGHTKVIQSYLEQPGFSNSIGAILVGQDGLWDFALKDAGAPAETTYCLRIVKSNGSLLDTYTHYAEITTSDGGPQLHQLMRHGQWFNSAGVRQPFSL